MKRLILGGLLLAAGAAAQETANVARLKRQCVVSPRLRPDVGSYRIVWGTVKFERMARIGNDDYYAQLCYPKQWMGKPADATRRSAALYEGIWRVPKGKRVATLQHFVFQDQGKVEAPRKVQTGMGTVWYLRAPCICPGPANLDAYFLVRDQQLKRLDTDSWERSLKLPAGSQSAGAAIDLGTMEGRVKLAPSGGMRVKLKLEGLKLAVEEAKLE